MKNRHERRRTTKLFTIERISFEQLSKMGSLCAWAGCPHTTYKPDEHGWSKLLLYTGPTQSDFLKIDGRKMARDAVLCPEHASYLDEKLLINIGHRFGVVQGNA